MANRTTRTPKKDALFLEALHNGASISSAAKSAAYGRTSIYQWRKDNPDFAFAWDEAVDCGTDLLEDEALRRAKDGVDEPRFYEGKVCGYVRRYSDTLIIFLLKARRPEKYRDRLVAQHQGADGGPARLKKTLPSLPRSITWLPPQSRANGTTCTPEKGPKTP